MSRVLVVDDDELVRRALVRAIGHLGHQVDATATPIVGLEAARRRPPDLLVTDYQMPGMDGVMLVARLQEALREKCPPVLFVSGSTITGLAAALPGVRTAFLSKPFKNAALATEVEALLGPGTTTSTGR